MKRNILKMSLFTAMVLSAGAYASQIVGADVTDPDNPVPAWDSNIQFGYGGLNLDNINVNVILEGVTTPIDFIDGAYPDMALEDTYQSSVFASDDTKLDEATRLGYVTQKIWPISEPSGIKVINNDAATAKDKPNNCIMASSYLADNYLDSTTEPKPVLCSSPAGSSKRFQLVLNDNLISSTADGAYGESIDLVFNIASGSTGAHKYQVFQKVSNFTDRRFDGLKIEVLKGTGDTAVAVPADLNISLGEGEEINHDGNPTGLDIWPEYEMAFYPPGLWGDGTKDHLPIGWFDVKPDGYTVVGHGTSTITTDVQLDGNYEALFGNWAPDKWVALGMHIEIDPTIEPVLLAYWGTTPDQVGDVNATPAWYYGMYNYDEQLTNFAPVPEEVLKDWAADLRTEANPDGKFVIDDIEDIPNLSLNYIINVGENITNSFTIRFTPKVSVDQTPPSYFDENGTRIDPILPDNNDTTSPVITLLGTTPVDVVQGSTYTDAGATAMDDADGDITDNIVTVNPVDTATVGEYIVTYNVSDAAGNAADEVTRTVNVVADNNDTTPPVITLLGTTPVAVVQGSTYTDAGATAMDDADGDITDNIVTVNPVDTATVGEYIVTYNVSDAAGNAADEVTRTVYVTENENPIEPPPASSGGGGCTYNPNSNSFDMTFLMMMTLGLLYPFRKRFIK